MKKTFIITLLLVSIAMQARAGKFLHAQEGKQIKGRYIVLLKDSVGADQVEAIARGLGREHAGRLVAIMKDGIRGFGIELPEGRARALARHPLVEQVEEDEEIELAAPLAPFDFASTLARGGPERVKSEWNNCGWAGSYYLCNFADDTYWHLDRIDNSGLIYPYKAYAYVSTGANVRAYVVDTGVWYDHQEFGQSPRQVGVDTGNPATTDAANMMVDPDLDDAPRPGEEPSVAQDYTPADYPCGAYQYTNASHGTAVASVLAGKYTGVAKDAKIIPVKIFNCAGQGSKLAMARGLDWIRQDMARHSTQRGVVSMSTFINVPTEGSHLCEAGDENAPLVNCVSAVESAINQLIAANVPVVVSANNQSNGNCSTSPARLGYGNESAVPSFHRTITVGGTMALSTNNYADQRWTCTLTPGGCTGYPLSGRGSNYGPCVSIYAPAYNIRVAGGTGPTSYRPAGQNSSGTSFSAPIVAGLIARLLSTPAYSTLTPHQLWLEVRNRAIGRNVQPADFDPSAVTNTWLAYMSALE
ncbi:MAG TPA: S8 family serine peptidase [Thermoanaerobaculia bacterium]